jgi:hypothetical protein
MALSHDDGDGYMPDASDGEFIDDNVTEEEQDDDFEEEENQSDAEEQVDKVEEDIVDDSSEASDERPCKKIKVPGMFPVLFLASIQANKVSGYFT